MAVFHLESLLQGTLCLSVKGNSRVEHERSSNKNNDIEAKSSRFPSSWTVCSQPMGRTRLLDSEERCHAQGLWMDLCHFPTSLSPELYTYPVPQ